MKPIRNKPAPARGKCAAIVQKLRAEMLAGKLALRQRLATRTELEKRFAASSRTVQKALDRLVADGFVIADGRRGTFVAKSAPHRSAYGLVLPVVPDHPVWSLYYEAIARSFRLLFPGATERRLIEYTNASAVTNLAGYERLLGDVVGHRLAGLIFAGPGFEFANTPVLTHPGMPRIGQTQKSMVPGVTVQPLDGTHYTRLLLERLQARGRRRVALFVATREGLFGILGSHLAQLRKQLTDQGIENRDEWVLPAPVGAPELAGHAARLLLRLPAAERPDTIVILDDNVVAGVTAGIATSGLPASKRPDVIAHCNFPAPPPHAVPVTLLGYDMRVFARQAIACIEAGHAGHPAPAKLPPVPAMLQEDGDVRPQ